MFTLVLVSQSSQRPLITFTLLLPPPLDLISRNKSDLSQDLNQTGALNRPCPRSSAPEGYKIEVCGVTRPIWEGLVLLYQEHTHMHALVYHLAVHLVMFGLRTLSCDGVSVLSAPLYPCRVCVSRCEVKNTSVGTMEVQGLILAARLLQSVEA